MATDLQKIKSTAPQFTLRFVFALMFVVAGIMGLFTRERLYLPWKLILLEAFLAGCVLMFVARHHAPKFNASTLSLAGVTVFLAVLAGWCMYTQFRTWFCMGHVGLSLFGQEVGRYIFRAHGSALSLVVVSLVVARISRRYPLPAFAASSILLLGLVVFFAVCYFIPLPSIRY